LFPFINKRFLSLITRYAQKVHVENLIRKILKKENIHLIYERHNEYDYGIKIGKTLGIKTVLELNGVTSQEAKLQGASEDQVRAIDNKELDRIKYADKIVAVSDGIKKYYSSLGVEKNKFLVIPNGVDSVLFKPMDKNNCRKKLGFGDFPIIGFVGSFRPYQGLETAIEMMPYVLKEIPQARLVLVGDAGKYYNFQFHPTIDELKELAKRLKIEKNVIFTGRITSDLLPLYINSFDLCLNLHNGLFFNGYFLGWSVKLFEYLACGRPIICSSIPDVKEIIQNYNCGICVESNNPEEMVEKIVFLIRNKKMCDMYGENGRKTVLENYTWGCAVNKLLSEFENV
jgi:glycosyltransferase involved in cell wall biosynthesis